MWPRGLKFAYQSDITPWASSRAAIGANEASVRPWKLPGCLDLVPASTLSISDQAHVERHRLVPAHFDLGRERLIPFFPDLEPVTPFRQRHHQALVARWTAPVFAVDEHVGIGGLDADDQRAAARRLFRSSGQWRRQVGRPGTERRYRPAAGERNARRGHALGSLRRFGRNRRRLLHLARSALLHGSGDLAAGVRAQIQMLANAAIAL